MLMQPEFCEVATTLSTKTATRTLVHMSQTGKRTGNWTAGSTASTRKSGSATCP
jgi:hypothetical protein